MAAERPSMAEHPTDALHPLCATLAAREGEPGAAWRITDEGPVEAWMGGNGGVTFCGPEGDVYIPRAHLVVVARALLAAHVHAGRL